MNYKLLVLLEIIRHVSFSVCSAGDEEAKIYYRSLPKVNFSLADGQPTDVIYTLFTDISDTEGKVITTETVCHEIKNKTIPTVLIIHGFTTDDTSPWYRPLKDEYFKLGPHNIIFINWSKAGNKTYFVSSANVKPIGKYMAEFLIASKVELKKIHLVGHSLGSQLTSFIGKNVKQLTGRKLGRITGLDPAGPSFSNPEMLEEERLNPNDAEFVDNIHTDIQIYGFTIPLGHVDFYPNAGGHQPGCPPRTEDDNCSHARSTLFFIESLSTKKCATEAEFSEKNYVVTVTPKKTYPKYVIFGQHIDTRSRGVYYFETKSEKPFLAE